MTMIGLFILALKITFIPFASTNSDVPCTICAFLGVENELTHPLPVDEIPKGCNAVYFSVYYLNEMPSQDNIKAIASLVNSNHTVFTGLATTLWNEVLTTDKYDGEIEKVAKFLTDNKICGIFLEMSVHVYNLKIPDLADKVNALVCKIKATAPTVKVGLTLNALHYYVFCDESLFSFAVANCAIDMYHINTGMAGIPCWEKTALEDPFPITLENSNYVGLDTICQGVAASQIDKSKVFFGLTIEVAVGSVQNQTLELALEYPQYCCLSQSDMNNDTQYCPSSLESYKKRASYVKPYAAGIFIYNLDYDYWNDDCGCERYAITNTMLDAFGCN